MTKNKELTVNFELNNDLKFTVISLLFEYKPSEVNYSSLKILDLKTEKDNGRFIPLIYNDTISGKIYIDIANFGDLVSLNGKNILSITFKNLENNKFDLKIATQIFDSVGSKYHSIEYVTLEPINILPIDYKLLQNFPNPFNSFTRIRFEIPQKSNVTVRIYDLLGREVKNLYEKDIEPGYYEIPWNSTDENNRTIASGTYFVILDIKDNGKVIKRINIKLLNIK